MTGLVSAWKQSCGSSPFARDLLAVGMCLLATGSCVTEVAGEDDCVPETESQEAFGERFSQMNSEFAEHTPEPVFHSKKCLGADSDKADFGFLPEPCDLLAPLVELGNDGLKMGFVLGAEGSEILGTELAYAGYDIVWDLYHQQMTVSKYSGQGVAFPNAGKSFSVYAGIGFGFEESVADWNGYFVSAETSVSPITLPFLQDFISLSPGAYVSARDVDGDELEILQPPDGVYGFTVGINVGVDLLSNLQDVFTKLKAIPGFISGAAYKEGLWTPYNEAIASFYKEFQETKMFFTTPMQVRLVDPTTNTECPEDWPAVEPERQCVIEFGNPSDSFLDRATNTAYSICHVSGRCAIPLAWPVSATALAVAALRDHGFEFSSMCSQ